MLLITLNTHLGHLSAEHTKQMLDWIIIRVYDVKKEWNEHTEANVREKKNGKKFINITQNKILFMFMKTFWFLQRNQLLCCWFVSYSQSLANKKRVFNIGNWILLTHPKQVAIEICHKFIVKSLSNVNVKFMTKKKTVNEMHIYVSS